MDGTMRVILACGNEGVHKRVKQMLSGEAEIEVVSRVTSYQEVLPETRRLLPDAVILLTDDRKSSGAAIKTVRAITEARLPTRAIIMTENVARDLVPAIKAGAAGLLSRSIDRSELLSALKIPAITAISEPVQDVTP